MQILGFWDSKYQKLDEFHKKSNFIVFALRNFGNAFYKLNVAL